MVKTLVFVSAGLFAALMSSVGTTGCGGGGESLGEAWGDPDLTDTRQLAEGWKIQSTQGVPEGGEIVSTAGFVNNEWYAATVPTTVVAALVADGVYPDPFFGMNLRSLPGTTYPIGSNFSDLPMPPSSPFRVPWWYRTEFDVPAEWQSRTVFLTFNGINYRAHIWINGLRIADADEVAGTYRIHTFDVSPMIRSGETNCIAVEVFPPKVCELAHTWVDWNPMPPDKNMGLWREVFITTGGPVRMRNPHVITDLPLPSLDRAYLTVTAEMFNRWSHPVKATINGAIEDARFSRVLEFDALEVKKVTFSPEDFTALTVSNPRLWWPAQLGPQSLYDLTLTVEHDGMVSDRHSVRFGIHEISSDLNEYGHRVFKINGNNVLIRGAGWAPDMLFRSSPEREEAEIQYVRNLNLNAIRFEGKLGSDHLLDLCDRYGVFVMAGWCCCDHWERWVLWDDEDHRVAQESMRSQLCRLRNHPSMLAWLNGSDFHPPPEVEQQYIDILQEYRWPNPILSSATEEPSPVTGFSGVKMTGPYDYVAPVYWLADKDNGGAFGFNTETSPGPAIPPEESLRMMLPEDHLWPIDDVWNYHAGGGTFGNVRIFTRALNERYGTATDLGDYVRKAQAMNYEAQRAMFEAYGRNKYASTGVIQWMLNNAWPSIIWHLYDYYLRPGGGYFGTKKACEPLHIQYSYDDDSIVIVNSHYQEFRHLRAAAKVYTIDMAEKYSRCETIDVPADSSVPVFTIPRIQGLSSTYFLSLTLENSIGETLSTNLYWLSTRRDIHAWGLSDWYHTPILVYGDLSALQGLPLVELDAHGIVERGSDGDRVVITTRNRSRHIAFMVRLQIMKGLEGEEVLPILWDDNYFSLIPGETREIVAVLGRTGGQAFDPAVRISGWNVSPVVHAAIE